MIGWTFIFKYNIIGSLRVDSIGKRSILRQHSLMSLRIWNRLSQYLQWPNSHVIRKWHYIYIKASEKSNLFHLFYLLIWEPTVYNIPDSKYFFKSPKFLCNQLSSGIRSLKVFCFVLFFPLVFLKYYVVLYQSHYLSSCLYHPIQIFFCIL